MAESGRVSKRLGTEIAGAWRQDKDGVRAYPIACTCLAAVPYVREKERKKQKQEKER
jgi:hypothetical protein